MSTQVDPPRRWQRIFVTGVLALVLIHSALVGLWLAPDNAIRAAVGNDRLASYVNPYFQQSWTRLDPRLQRVDETLELRAVIIHPDTGEEITTDWINPVDLDLQRSGGWRNRDRASDITRHLAVNLNQMILNLEPAHRPLVAQDYTAGSARQLRGDLEQAGVDPRDAANYAVTERMVVTFASLYADAYWQGRVMRVQVRPGIRVLTEDRSVASTDQEFRRWDIGWRDVTNLHPAAQRSFAPYVADRV